MRGARPRSMRVHRASSLDVWNGSRRTLDLPRRFRCGHREERLRWQHQCQSPAARTLSGGSCHPLPRAPATAVQVSPTGAGRECVDTTKMTHSAKRSKADLRINLDCYNHNKAADGLVPTNYFFTTTINGLSLAALLWTTSAFAFVLALSLRARWTSSAAIIPASPVLRSVAPCPSISTVTSPSMTWSSSWAPGCMCQGAAVPGPNSTTLTTVSWTTCPWFSKSFRRIWVSFGPAGACASANFEMAGTATVIPEKHRNSRRIIFMTLLLDSLADFRSRLFVRALQIEPRKRADISGRCDHGMLIPKLGVMSPS